VVLLCCSDRRGLTQFIGRRSFIHSIQKKPLRENLVWGLCFWQAAPDPALLIAFEIIHPMNETPPLFELPKPDLAECRKGNAGVEGVWQFDSGLKGRHVLVTALIHGNELCGAWAVLAALQAGLRPKRGVLTLAFCNLAAFDLFDAQHPDDSRFTDEDLNRVWGDMPWRGDSHLSQEKQRALQLLPFVERADWLLDLHSMHAPGPPLVLTGLAPRHAELAQQLLTPELLVADAGHAAGKRMRDHGRFGQVNGDDGSRALLIECGFHGELPARDVATDMLGRFLIQSACVDEADVPSHWLKPLPTAQRLLHVTHAVTVQEGEPTHFAQDWGSGQCVPQAGTLLGWNGGQPLRTPYADCTLVMPTLRHAKPGSTLVRLARQA
jgi:Succinylglutamate desuccinylase / Aspartoacylase family